jgi:hypothetical protein
MKHPLFNQIQTTLKEALDYIAKFEKLSPQEGVIKVIYGVNEKGVEIFAPHFVPQALSYTWTASSFDKAFELCLKDVRAWYEVEKDAPRNKFWLDI